MKLTKILDFGIACIVSVFAAACTVSPSENDKCQLVLVNCWAYGPPDECGNATCAPQDVEDSIFRVRDSLYYASIYEAVQESGKYTTKDSVAAYLCKFDKLPSNYVSEDEAQKLYESKTGKTFEKWNFNPWTTIGVMIGGDKFDNYTSYNNYNYHATLPQGSYHEADVDYPANNRGTKRLVYQSDCIIYYTSNHYETFSKLEIH